MQKKLTNEISKFSKFKNKIKEFFGNTSEPTTQETILRITYDINSNDITPSNSSVSSRRISINSSAPSSRRASLALSPGISPLFTRRNFSHEIESAKSSITSPLVSPVPSPLATPTVPRRFSQEISNIKKKPKMSPILERKKEKPISNKFTEAHLRAREIAKEIKSKDTTSVELEALRLEFIISGQKVNITNIR